MVSKVMGSLTIQVLLDRLPINHLIQLQEWEAVDVFGNHGLCGLPEEGAHEKSPKCLGGNLGDFVGILQRSQAVNARSATDILNSPSQFGSSVLPQNSHSHQQSSGLGCRCGF